MPLGEMYANMLSIGHMASLPFPPLKPSFPNWYKTNLTCEYHARNPGHCIDTCSAFKRKLLQLFKVGWITLEDTPNINSNPMPNHASSCGGVNVVEVLRVTMDRLYDMLVQVRCLLIKNESGSRKSANFYRFHEAMRHNIDECEEFHQKVIQMMTCGMLKIEKKKNDIVVGMISFQRKKAKMWP
jgi:hypothetical protein